MDGDAERQRVLDRLDIAARSHAIAFWWRDDDAVSATPPLDRLLALASRQSLPLALAVIPAAATGALATRLSAERDVSVLQHGWSHRDHSAPGEKKIELGGNRPLAEVLDELQSGHARLQELFADRFLPVLVPPWNRIGDDVRAARRAVGLVGLSTFGPAPREDRHWVNTHLDILAWRPTRPLGRAAAYRILAGEVERRLAGDPEPIGIMTHHLVHEDESWALLEEMFTTLAHHPGATWPGTGELFRLDER